MRHTRLGLIAAAVAVLGSKPGELTQAMGNLPSSAWPYGRVVAVTENGVRGSADDDVKIRTNRAIVAGTLESMHVLINWVPSA